MQPPLKLALTALAVICVVVCCSNMPITAAQGGPPPFNVNVQFNGLFASLACGNAASPGIGFIETLNQFTLLNLAQYQSLAVLKAGNGPTAVSVQDSNAVAAFAAHYIMVSEFRYLKGFLDETLKNATDALQLSAPQERSARLVAQGVAKQLLASRSGEGYRYTAGSIDYPAASNASVGEWSYAFPSADYLPDRFPLGLDSATNRMYVLSDPEVYRTESLKKFVVPKISSAVYQNQYTLAFNLGRDSSTARTADQTASAAFWNQATAGSVCNPMAAWINATVMALPPTTTVQRSVQIFTELGVVASDVFALNQHLQYTFRNWRPVDAIKRGDARNPAVPDWSPLLATPSSPEYPSIGATLAGAMATVLTARLSTAKPVFLGTITAPILPPGPSVPATVGPRSFRSWTAAAQDMANSGVWAGIQFNSSCVDGLAIGKQAATWILGHLNDRTPTGTQPDTILLEYTASKPKTAGVPRAPAFSIDIGP